MMAPESTTKCLTRSTLFECCIVVAAGVALAPAVDVEEEEELVLSGMLSSAEAILSTPPRPGGQGQISNRPRRGRGTCLRFHKFVPRCNAKSKERLKAKKRAEEGNQERNKHSLTQRANGF